MRHLERTHYILLVVYTYEEEKLIIWKSELTIALGYRKINDLQKTLITNTMILNTAKVSKYLKMSNKSYS